MKMSSATNDHAYVDPNMFMNGTMLINIFTRIYTDNAVPETGDLDHDSGDSTSQGGGDQSDGNATGKWSYLMARVK